MNKFLLGTILFATLVVGCGEKKGDMVDGKLSTEVIDPKNPPVIEFKDTTYNFGTISQGEMVSFTFYFKNTGGSSLVLTDVRPSCGCTVPKDWPKDPIAPGEEGKIDVTFDSAGKQGKVTKSIRVVANTKPTTHILRLEGEIKAPGSEEEG
ncbi:MAG TPA: DUF1573 domain-containing protein [Flavobacteriales bacterium]|nr:DUF1573 domain-containing protein [Flavobacteriales bacterium]